MRKVLAMTAVAALAAGVSAFAANPFSDVSTDDWAYQAVSDLSDQGIVEGYPDGTFRGERNITRYELAQIVARLLANEDQYNAEQRATIDRLASEYADELNNLGVRVSNLEAKVGNISWSGDARMRYRNKAYGNDVWDGRMRIKAVAQVNDDTTVTGRLRADMNFTEGDDEADVYMDNLYVTHNFGSTTNVRLGRYGAVFGDQAGWLYGDAKGIDGAELNVNVNDHTRLTAGYGRFNVSDYGEDVTEHDVFYARGQGHYGFGTVGIDYLRFSGDTDDDGNGAEILGGNLNIPVGDFRVFGDYYVNTTAGEDDTAWNAGVGYGKINLSRPGTWALDVAYNDVDKGVYFGGTGLMTDVLSAVTTHGATNVTYWNAMADIVLQKNIYLHTEYAFGAEAEGAADPDDAWNVTINFAF
jgi:hypothetical protein